MFGASSAFCVFVKASKDVLGGSSVMEAFMIDTLASVLRVWVLMRSHSHSSEIETLCSVLRVQVREGELSMVSIIVLSVLCVPRVCENDMLPLHEFGAVRTLVMLQINK